MSNLATLVSIAPQPTPISHTCDFKFYLSFIAKIGVSCCSCLFLQLGYKFFESQGLYSLFFFFSLLYPSTQHVIDKIFVEERNVC